MSEQKNYDSFIESVVSKKPVDAKAFVRDVLESKKTEVLESYSAAWTEKNLGETTEMSIEEAVESLSDEDLAALAEELEALETDGLTEEEIHEVSKQRLGAYINKAAESKAKMHLGSSEAHKHYFSGNDDHYKKKGSPFTARQVHDRYDHAEKKRTKGIHTAIKKLTKEEDENIDDILDQLDEVSKERLGKYINAAHKAGSRSSADFSHAFHGGPSKGYTHDDLKHHEKKIEKRRKGIATAVKKLTK